MAGSVGLDSANPLKLITVWTKWSPEGAWVRAQRPSVVERTHTACLSKLWPQGTIHLQNKRQRVDSCGHFVAALSIFTHTRQRHMSTVTLVELRGVKLGQRETTKAPSGAKMTDSW